MFLDKDQIRGIYFKNKQLENIFLKHYNAPTPQKMPFIDYKEKTGLDNRTGTATFLLLDVLRLIETTHTENSNITIYTKRDTPILIVNEYLEVLIAPCISEDLTEKEEAK